MSNYTPNLSSEPVQTAAAPPANNIALISMILGIVSFVCCGPMCSLPAVITGHIALSKMRRKQISEENKGFAIAGLALGYINLLLFVILLIAYAIMFFFIIVSGNAGTVSPFIYTP